jgi:hypothetical protein
MTVAMVSLAGFACGGGDKKTIDIGNGEVTVGDELPDSFPDDFPIYDGADLQGVVQGEQGGISGTVATWETNDDFEKVKKFYDAALKDGPWKSLADGTVAGSTFWSVENSAGEEQGYVQIADTNPTRIVVVVGNRGGDIGGDVSTPDSGSGDPSSGSDSSGGDLPKEVALPDDFPSDQVPLPDDIRITNASSVNAGGTQSRLLQFYSKDSADDLASFFKDELEGKGFTQSIQQSQDGGIYAIYSENDDGSGLLVSITILDGDVAGYRQVTLQITSS